MLAHGIRPGGGLPQASLRVAVLHSVYGTELLCRSASILRCEQTMRSHAQAAHRPSISFATIARAGVMGFTLVSHRQRSDAPR
jgi:hypothetical protein